MMSALDGDAIAIEQIDGKWAVQIVEGGETTQHLFEAEEFAVNFAEGQLIRIGVSSIIRIAHDDRLVCPPG